MMRETEVQIGNPGEVEDGEAFRAHFEMLQGGCRDDQFVFSVGFGVWRAPAGARETHV